MVALGFLLHCLNWSFLLFAPNGKTSRSRSNIRKHKIKFLLSNKRMKHWADLPKKMIHQKTMVYQRIQIAFPFVLSMCQNWMLSLSIRTPSEMPADLRWQNNFLLLIIRITSGQTVPGVIRIIIANPTVPSIMYAEQNDSFFDNFYSADYYWCRTKQ